MNGRRFHLVLGAGGERGWDWTVGVLLALSDRTGIDARQAHSVVGTSVGALIGAYLTHGIGPEQLTRHIGGPPGAVGGGEEASLVDLRSSLVDAPVAGLRRGIGSLIGIGVRRHRILPSVGDEMAKRLPVPSWPSTLRVVAWDRTTRRRLVFDHSSPLDLPRAVDASCAVPGLYPAVEVGDAVLVDGGVVSMTNADLSHATAGDVMIVVAPNVLPTRWPDAVRALPRWAHRATLVQELARVRGVDVLVLGPSTAWVAAAGDDRRARVAAARAEADRILADISLPS